MGNKSFIAQVAVFVLVGLNVAAYYVFWPRPVSAPSDDKADGPFVQSLTAEKKSPAMPAPPADFPAPVEPASMPSLTPPAKDPILELLTRIQKDAAPAPKLLDIGALPPLTDPGPMVPKKLPPLQADPVPLPVPTPDANLAAKVQSSWQFTMEIVGTRRQVTVQGPEEAMRFKIHCDHVDTRPADGVFQAIGNVTFDGAGIHGRCQRLSLSRDKLRVTFEDDVEIGNSAPPGSLLRSEKVVWEAPLIAPRKASETRPVTFREPTPLERPVLGPPAIQ